MDASNWSVLGVALISVISAWLAGRAAKSASKYTSEASVMNSKTLAETEAYNRARKMDTETIERQDKQIIKLLERVRVLEENEERLNMDNDRLRQRVTALERKRGSGASHG